MFCLKWYSPMEAISSNPVRQEPEPRGGPKGQGISGEEDFNSAFTMGSLNRLVPASCPVSVED